MKAEEILSLLPEKDLAFLSAETRVDHQVKKLYGIAVFKLILFSMLHTTRLSLRVMESFLVSAQFKKFAKKHAVNAKYNSIRDRLSTIDSIYFEKLFELTFIKFNRVLKEEAALSIIDSTFISMSSKLVTWGMKVGHKNSGLKFLKFTVSLKGSLPSSVQFYEKSSFLSDDIAFPDAIFKNKFLDSSLLVFDRGLQKRDAFEDMSNQDILFVGRIKTDVDHRLKRKLKLPKPDKKSTVELIEDTEVYLINHCQLTTHSYRLIKMRIKNTGEVMYLITNFFEATAYEIAIAYKQRWEIELFFKFLKQHLNLKHLVSRNENAVKVMIYMTLILAMLIIVYKKSNKISSFKIAKLKFEIELDNQIIREIVILCGGNPLKASYLWGSS